MGGAADGASDEAAEAAAAETAGQREARLGRISFEELPISCSRVLCSVSKLSRRKSAARHTRPW